MKRLSQFRLGAVSRQNAGKSWPRVVFGEGPAMRPGLLVGVGGPGKALTMHAHTQRYILGTFNFYQV